jgi:hypothetical protein
MPGKHVKTETQRSQNESRASELGKKKNKPIPDVCQTAFVLEHERLVVSLISHKLVQFLGRVLGLLVGD